MTAITAENWQAWKVKEQSPTVCLEWACEQSALLRRTLDTSRRYLFDAAFYVLPSNLPVYSVMCILWDESGHPPRFTLGAKASQSLTSAILGSLEEAHQLRPWMRRIVTDVEPANLSQASSGPRNLKDRGRLWLSPRAITHLQAWLAQAEEWDICSTNPDFPIDFDALVNAVARDGGTVYSVDTTQNLPALVQEAQLTTVKIVVPEFQPLYLTEELRDMASNRLKSSDSRLRRTSQCSGGEFFLFPHPFL